MKENKPELICDIETGICRPAGEEDGPMSGFIDLSADADGDHAENKIGNTAENGKAD